MVRGMRAVVAATTLGAAVMAPPARPLAAGAASRVASALDVHAVLERIGERVQAYYDRFQSIICTEIVQQQPLNRDLTPDGRAREFTYELRIEAIREGAARPVDFEAIRALRLIDGRPPRRAYERGCMDPHEAYSEPLMFLLPEHQADYRFTLAGRDREGDVEAIVLEFTAVRSGRPRVSWEDNCFSFTASGHTRGRVWVDAATFDVLRIDARLLKAMEFPVPREMWRQTASRLLTLERADSSVRYREVVFRDPDETVRLPASVSTLHIIQGAAVPRIRVRQAFRDYRRFLIEATVRP
jgi:hypothetical protein